MNKVYKKFYSIGDNNYYTLHSNDDMFIATESFVEIKKIFGTKQIPQGLKLLKVTVPLMVLFENIRNLKPEVKQKYDHEDMITYDLKFPIGNMIQNKVYDYYQMVIRNELDSLGEKCEEAISKIKESDSSEDEKEQKIKDILAFEKDCKKTLDKNNPFNSNLMSFVSPKSTTNQTLKGMVLDNLNHLYTENISTKIRETYMYEVDIFGTLTIYRVVSVNNIIKTIETFIYNVDIIRSFFEKEELNK